HDLIHPEPVAELGHLNDNRRHVESERSSSIDYVLIWTCDDPLFGHDVVGKHPQVVDWSGWYRSRHDYFGNLLVRETPIVDIHKWPSPKVGVPSDKIGVFLRHLRSFNRPRRHGVCPTGRRPRRNSLRESGHDQAKKGSENHSKELWRHAFLLL